MHSLCTVGGTYVYIQYAKHQICEVQYVWPSSLTYVCTPHMHTYVHTCTFGLTLKFMYIYIHTYVQ